MTFYAVEKNIQRHRIGTGHGVTAVRHGRQIHFHEEGGRHEMCGYVSAQAASEAWPRLFDHCDGRFTGQCWHGDIAGRDPLYGATIKLVRR